MKSSNGLAKFPAFRRSFAFSIAIHISRNCDTTFPLGEFWMARSFSIQIFLESFCFSKEIPLFNGNHFYHSRNERENFPNLKDPFIRRKIVFVQGKEELMYWKLSNLITNIANKIKSHVNTTPQKKFNRERMKRMIL